MTQAQLSLASGVQQSDISKLENGTVAGSTKVVQLARALRCDPYWLATGEGEVWGQPAAEDMEFAARGGNVVGVEVRGASEFLPDDVEIDASDPSTKGVILGSGVHSDGYAIRVVGDTNAPALKDGQFVVVDGTQVWPGELALFKMTDGRILLRELLHETDDAYHVDSPKWGGRETLQKDNVSGTEMVVAIVSPTRWVALELLQPGQELRDRRL